ncbi:MAG: DUF3683 domain-containing protein [Burkholderiales bacterium]|nr:DUF3683 domain-containing protein [Burkholderiales bacterium]
MSNTATATAVQETPQRRVREIPYNYTSYSDKEIVERLLGKEAWQILEDLRDQRRTGRSARMLYEVLGDIWVIQRNPYLQEDMLYNKKRRTQLVDALYHRINEIEKRRDHSGSVNDAKVGVLIEKALLTVEKFKSSFERSWDFRKLVLKKLKKHTNAANIRFDGFSKASHVTDATDWRIHYPFVVIFPDKESEIPGIVRACTELDLTIIARGGGTGYTGGAVPLHAKTAVINTEKLDKISNVEMKVLDGHTENTATIFAEAGAINKTVAEKAASEGWIFSVDPNSNYACTIGGNIAENAGGKKAVLWGTAADNLSWYRMVGPNAEWIEVTRLDHNLGKLHTEKEVAFEVAYKEGKKDPEKAPVIRSEVIRFPGSIVRKPGLGKDVTNKYLGGLPGLQKEGCDGIITSARFILHKMPPVTETVCMEFYGAASNAGPAIYAISQLLESHPDGVMLAGLEHLDDRYLHAINYAPKSHRGGYPKMVIVGDIIGNDEASIAKQIEKIKQIAAKRSGAGFVAKTPEGRHQFWAERSRTSAISKHTNAFKLNEDIVIPLDKIGEYTDACELFNIQCSISNKLEMIDEVEKYLNGPIQLGKLAVSSQGFTQEELLSQRHSSAIKLLETVKKQWTYILDNLFLPKEEAVEQLRKLGREVEDKDISDSSYKTLLDLVQNHKIRVSWKKEIITPLFKLYGGDAFETVRENVKKIHDKVLRGRVFIALHMHAGDGNVHTNIPVNSDNVKMLRTANEAVAYVMRVAKRLGGAISGEHGIGLTKIEFVEPGELDDFYQYLEKVDPHGHFNKGKLRPEANLSLAYTPSFNLLGHESLILQNSELKQISDEIKTCLRCGKCKPVCSTHVPGANLLYSPRNKIIVTSLLIEAFLYEEQTRRGVSRKHYIELADLADHCTVCQKCQKPCPVKIDFGHVTMLTRNMLHRLDKEHSNPVKYAGLKFLEVENPIVVRGMRKAIIQGGFKAQRMAADALKLPAMGSAKHPGFSTGRPALKDEVIHLVNRKLPKVRVPTTSRKLLGIEEQTYVPIVRNAKRDEKETVFYFPGCGNERLFSEISIAVLGMLQDLDIQTVLPPGYLCCGYPQAGNGLKQKSEDIVTHNRVLFHRVANTLNYKDIKTVLVSCGTCLHQLKEYNFEKIFPGCRVMDVHDFLKEKGISFQGLPNTRYIYHDPCHTPLKEGVPIKTVNAVFKPQDGSSVTLSDRCCGESGTFAIGRPDISSQVRFAKESSLKEAVAQHRKDGFTGDIKVLTTCPGCLQGIDRYSSAVKAKSEFLIVEMMTAKYGKNWMQQAISKIKDGNLEKVLL